MYNISNNLVYDLDTQQTPLSYQEFHISIGFINKMNAIHKSPFMK